MALPFEFMIDVIYIAAMSAFFLVMLAFVRGLEVLGRDSTTETDNK